jgi:hypothetical protein
LDTNAPEHASYGGSHGIPSEGWCLFLQTNFSNACKIAVNIVNYLTFHPRPAEVIYTEARS